MGAGIVGLATARALVRDGVGPVVVLEAEPKVAAHQTGNNSGVVHSGLYYRPGSLKARNCTEGRALLEAFCREHDLPWERCGKVVVATTAQEVPRLEELERRGRENGLEGVRRLGPEELREREPHVRAAAALLVPETGIVDFVAVAQRLADEVRAGDGEVRTCSRVREVRREAGSVLLGTEAGEVRARFLVNCAGLQSDRLARLCGVEPGLAIVPFRGEYYELLPERTDLVRHLIYPVPDPRYPFLGVHFTRMIHGGVEAGPNAVLAFRREGYRRSSVSLRDVAAMFAYRGFWNLARQHWRTAVGEWHRSLFKSAFVRALQCLVPEVRPSDVKYRGAGVRAQALEPTGALVDDFRILTAERMVHVLNAPSPAATAALAIGEAIAREVHGLRRG